MPAKFKTVDNYPTQAQGASTGYHHQKSQTNEIVGYGPNIEVHGREYMIVFVCCIIVVFYGRPCAPLASVSRLAPPWWLVV